MTDTNWDYRIFFFAFHLHLLLQTEQARPPNLEATKHAAGYQFRPVPWRQEQSIVQTTAGGKGCCKITGLEHLPGIPAVSTPSSNHPSQQPQDKDRDPHSTV